MLLDREHIQPMRSTLFLREHHDSLLAFVHSLHKLTGYIIFLLCFLLLHFFLNLQLGFFQLSVVSWISLQNVVSQNCSDFSATFKLFNHVFGLMIPSPPSRVGSERRILSLSFRAMRPDKEGMKEYLMASSRGASWS